MPVSPAVIRRRRATALAVLALLVAAALVVLLGAGGPGSAAAQITTMLTRGSAEPATLCDDLSAAMLEAIGGRDGCRRASPARGPAGRVREVRVDGSRARAVIVTDAGDEVVTLVHQDGAWKVDDVR